MIEHLMLHMFGGRMDAWGQDQPDGSGRAVHGHVTHDLIRDHLHGRQGVGIYPMWHQDDRWYVKWGCCDIDTGDWQEAYGLATALKSMGFTPFIERSRSKGWHIWVFSDGPIEAKYVRRALKVAYAAIGLQAREANPKTEHLVSPTQLGNYVRLPFKADLASGEPLTKQTMMTSWTADSDGIPVRSAEMWFASIVPSCRAHPSLFQYWADKWVEPERKRLATTALSDQQVRAMFKGMPDDLLGFIKDGPDGTSDRSEALVALAWKMKRAGYTGTEIYAAVDAADKRWGKYHMRPDGHLYIQDIVERTL